MFIKFLESKFRLTTGRLNFKKRLRLKILIKKCSIFIKSLIRFITRIQHFINSKSFKENIPLVKWNFLKKRLSFNAHIKVKNNEFLGWLRVFLTHF